jgi:hypothetical protein
MNPTSPWKTAADAALADRLDDQEVVELIARARTGDTQATSDLEKGLAWLIYDVGFTWTGRAKKRRLDEIIGCLYEGLKHAVIGLVKEDFASPERYVRNKLWRQIREHIAAQRQSIGPRRSVNRYRELHGLEPYPVYKYVDYTLTQSDPLDGDDWGVLEQPNYVGPVVRDKRGGYRGPSRFHNAQDDVKMVDLMDEFAHSPRTQAVANLLIQGCSSEEIAQTLGLTDYQVRQERRSIRAHYEHNEITQRSQDPALEPLTPPADAIEIRRAAEFEAFDPCNSELTLAI